ncbi:MAG: hypothetical protein JWP34_1588 [Massilia sp.]|jgi:hypothetical protein|nr:hypothetical protein [Massilia sp.]
MNTLVAELAGKIKLLSTAEKNDLLKLLLLEVDGVAGPDADEAWRNEIVHRVKAIRNGEAAIRSLQEQWHE